MLVYRSYLQVACTAEYGLRASSGTCRMRNANAILDLRPRDDKVFSDSLRLARTRSRDVTRDDGGARLAVGPWRAVQGARVGCRVYSASRDMRISRRSFLYGEFLIW